MRTVKILLIAGGLVSLAAVLGAGYFLFVRPQTLPVYQLSQQPSTLVDHFTATTLTLGDTIYVHDAAEMPLQMTAASAGWSSLIGKTQDGMDVFAVPQQDSNLYVMLTTEMYPNEVFRNKCLKPVALDTYPYHEIRLLTNPGSGPRTSTSRDEALVAEVVASLTTAQGTIDGAPTAQSGTLLLMSDQLPGLAYQVYASAGPDGQVYLAEVRTPEDWIPAGPLFSAWFEEALGK